jgi:hypothetical protein
MLDRGEARALSFSKECFSLWLYSTVDMTTIIRSSLLQGNAYYLLLPIFRWCYFPVVPLYRWWVYIFLFLTPWGVANRALDMVFRSH